MSKHDVQDAELVSLLADGELPAQDVGRAMAYLTNSGEAQQTWDSYHLIGEVMRSGQAGARAHDPEFVQKLRRKLVHEAIEFVAVDAIPISATGQEGIKTSSANDGWWRRVAGFASVALVGVLAWQGYVLLDGHGASVASQLAQVGGTAAVLRPAGPNVAMANVNAGPAASAALLAATPSGVAKAHGELQPVMLRDPRLDALLAAHRQFGGTSALQMPSGFLRNATFDEGQR